MSLLSLALMLLLPLGCVEVVVEGAPSRESETGDSDTTGDGDGGGDPGDGDGDPGDGDGDPGDGDGDTEAECGNGVIERSEECDDGVNDGSYNGCNPDCTPGPSCGDGLVNDAEACDDGVNGPCLNDCSEWEECEDFARPGCPSCVECVIASCPNAHAACTNDAGPNGCACLDGCMQQDNDYGSCASQCQPQAPSEALYDAIQACHAGPCSDWCAPPIPG